MGKDNQNQTECKYYLNQSLYSSVGIWNDVNQTKNSKRDIIYLFTYFFIYWKKLLQLVRVGFSGFCIDECQPKISHGVPSERYAQNLVYISQPRWLWTLPDYPLFLGDISTSRVWQFLLRSSELSVIWQFHRVKIFAPWHELGGFFKFFYNWASTRGWLER